MANQVVEGLNQLLAVILEHLDVGEKVILGSIGLLRFEPLELSRNLVDLVLDGGVRGDLHRGYRVD